MGIRAVSDNRKIPVYYRIFVEVVYTYMSQPNNPLHGITLKKMLQDLEARYGWEYMGNQIPIRCFTHNPSLSSSLKFLRKTPWARAKVEKLYLFSLNEKP